MARQNETKDLPNGPTGGAVLATHFVVLGIAALLILVRVVLRLRVQRGSLLVSDALLFLAWGAAVATAAFDVVLYHHGLLMPFVTYGLKGWTPPDFPTLEYVLEMVWMSVIPYFLAFYLTKAAVLAVYLQLFPVHMRTHRMVLYAVMAYVAGAFISSMGLHLFICLPIKTNWNVLDPTLPECPRQNNATTFRVAWALHIIGNIMIFALPFSLIYKLQLRTKMKISVYAVLMLGLIDIAFSLTRYIEIELSVVNTASSLTLISLWSSLDVNIGVIVACLPALRPLLRQNMKASTDGYYGSYGTGTGTGSQTPARLAAIRREQGFEVISEPNDGKSGPARSSPTHVVGGPMGPSATNSSWDRHGEKLGTSDSDIELVTPSGSERRSRF